MHKRIILICLLIFTLFSLVGCRPEHNSNITLRFVSWGNEREEKTLRQLISQFESQHPGIKVELQITPHSRVFDRLMISTAGGRPPDVSRISSLWIHPCASKGLFEPLDDYVERDNFDIDDFYSQAVEGWGKYQGKLYALPTDIDLCAMYYNKTMFDKAGIPYPDWSWDWDKYLEVAKKLTRDNNGDGRLDQWGTSTEPYWQSYVNQNGSSVLTPDLKRCNLTDTDAYEGVQWMCDLINKHRVSPNAEERAEIGNMKLFTSGKIGMYISGSWASALLFKDLIKDFEYDVAPLPKGKKRATFIGGAGYAVLSRSKHKDAAWEFVKWMTGREYQRISAVDLNIIPSRKSVAKSNAYLGKTEPPEHRKVFLQMIQFGVPDPPVSVSPEMNELMNAELGLAILGRKTAKEACEEVTPKVNQLLRRADR